MLGKRYILSSHVLCASRLWPPSVALQHSAWNYEYDSGFLDPCRLPVEAMQALEDKIRSLEQFLRTRRNQRRGHYGRIMGVGDVSIYGAHTSPFGIEGFARGEIPSRVPGFETPQPRGTSEWAPAPGSMHKRQRVPFRELSAAELAAMEVSNNSILQLIQIA
jgi:hypothetical protein